MHEKFGQGKITDIEGNWPETKATIAFTNAGEKKLLLKYAKLILQN
jgi:DNA helicase-2/ATP-dependent DNA helicase PcrA